jgi:hypothetical protein
VLAVLGTLACIVRETTIFAFYSIKKIATLKPNSENNKPLWGTLTSKYKFEIHVFDDEAKVFRKDLQTNTSSVPFGLGILGMNWRKTKGGTY